jgi:hypothetical protein
VHDLVIVVSDLYVSQEAPERELPHGFALPGLEHAARFGSRARVAGGWRSWLAQWLTADPQSKRSGAAASETGARGDADRELIGAAPATVAAALLSLSSPASAPSEPSEQHMVWMATPVHLLAGLTSLHLDRRSILRLSIDDVAAFATEFRRVFHDSGFVLEPLDSGDFLLFGPQMPIAQTIEPARAMGTSIADAQPVGTGDPALRRLGAEIEMWLHEHPINDVRRRRGEAPVTGLWLWGGGPSPVPRERAPRRPREAAANTPQPGGSPLASTASTDIAFGRDAYLRGLWASIGKKVFPLPQQLAEVFGYPEVRRAALVIEISPMLHANPSWTFFDAVAQIDRAFIAPAVEALDAGRLERLLILANDYQLTVRARDRFKLWRRIPPGLSGLQ